MIKTDLVQEKEKHMTIRHRNTKASFKNLAALLTGQLILPEDAAYEVTAHLYY